MADQNANTIINTFLVPTEIPIISEENKQTDYKDRSHWNRCWIVDPLDGTKEFVKRNGEFTVNIALIEDGTPILGVIYVPVSKTLYFTGEAADKSFKIVLEDEDISVDAILLNASEINPANESEPVKVVGSRSHLNDDTKAFISEIEKEKTVEIVSKGSSLKFCLVAEGAAHLYPRFAPTMEWDTAAAHAILLTVGKNIYQYDESVFALDYLQNNHNYITPKPQTTF
jgi:3'(2'), 5'-bisphosphate nucleotidase